MWSDNELAIVAVLLLIAGIALGAIIGDDEQFYQIKKGWCESVNGEMISGSHCKDKETDKVLEPPKWLVD